MYVYVGISFLYDRDGGREKETILRLGILTVYKPKLFSCFLQNVCQSYFQSWLAGRVLWYIPDVPPKVAAF